MTKKKKPQLLKGFRDLFGAELLARQRLLDLIRKTFERYGFVPLETPALEEKPLLVGSGEEASKQIFLFTDPDGKEVGLRYELTASLGRVVASYQELPRPFKRYQAEPVWRYDKPGPGRFRQFLQFDIDTVGAKSLLADAEIIAAIGDCLEQIGLGYRIRVSSRRLLDTMVAWLGLPTEMAKPVFRVLDKLDKQGLEKIKLELGPGLVDKSGDPIPGLGLSEKQVGQVESFLKQTAEERGQTLANLKTLLGDSAGAEQAIAELEELDGYLTALRVGSEQAFFDLSIARGLDYYTGPVFEAEITDERLGRFGSVMGGGRYDELIGQYTGQPVPAVGASIGVDRLLAAMREVGMVEERASTASVLVVTPFKELLGEYVKIATELRRAGINTELYLGKPGGLGKQLKYADRKGIPIVVVVGPEEMEKNEVSIKIFPSLKTFEGVDDFDRQEYLNTVRFSQLSYSRDDYIEEIKKDLKEIKKGLYEVKE
ncbi:histidine--tRNA ligase [bacterium]|nr:histidine--tRNA ligase [bacterium]